MQFKRRRELKRTKIEIIPMIDTIFFLLVFFMLSSLALVKLRGIQVDLPRASTSTGQQAHDVTITIDKDRHLFLNNSPVEISALKSGLLEKAGGPSADLTNASVIISADRTVPHGLVVHCIDTARQIGITHFAIATVAGEESDGY